MSSPALTLGPFELSDVIATGGMAAVWDGAHTASRTRVAIKVMRGDRARDATWQSAFRAEVRAMARLNHPCIARVHDYGQLPDHAAELNAQLVPGAPYLVMEYLGGGTLSDRVPSGWSEVKLVLANLLDALAEAHSQGVVHRDLKPANVLFNDTRSQVVLTDFGIAHAMDRGDGTGSVMDGGTPPFMAPEQFEGRWRDTGPWTDLYALGCLAWALVTGHPPYGHRTWVRAAMAHAKQPIPALRPRMPLPDDIESWLHRLLQKDPAHRFRRAADTAWALQALGDAPDPDIALQEVSSEAPTIVLSGAATLPWRPLSENPTGAVTRSGPLVPRQQVGVEGQPMGIQTPPIPRVWRTEEGTLRRMAGAGLGLLGLQELPTIGRTGEREMLWTTLQQCRVDQESRAVVLTGAAGCGKSRLADWLVRRAHGVGACSWMRATHDLLQGPHHGMGPMLSRSLGLAGLSRGEAIARTRSLLTEWAVYDTDEAVALVSLTMPPGPEERDGRVIRFSSAIERHVLVLRQLRRLARSRVAVLWLDDVQWSEDALELTEVLLEQADFPLMILLTSRDEALMERPVETELLRSLLDHERVSHVPIRPLNEADQHALVRRWLGLGADLARTVEQRAAGNPLFAVQLVGDWVDRGLLVPTAAGFALRDGALAEIPDDLHDMWLSRVERVLQGTPPSWRQALEIGSALGVEVDLTEWRQICTDVGVTPSEQLLESMTRARLARFDNETWEFVHGMLRESVERAARDAGTWENHNRACARWMAFTDQPGRLGTHLLAAGDHDEAAGPLLRHLKSRLRVSDLRMAEVVLDQVDEALTHAGADARDPRWGSLSIHRSRLLLDRGHPERALALAEEIRELSRQNGWQRQAAEGARAAGEVHRDRPDVPRASALFAEAARLFEKIGDVKGVAAAQTELARCATFSGDYERALVMLGKARKNFERAPDGAHNGFANCDRAEGDVEVRMGRNLPRAIRLFRRAGDAYRRIGMRWGEANCMNGMAEIARLQGDLEGAEAGYRRAVQLTEAMGHSGGDIMRINLAMVGISRDNHEEAEVLLREVLARMVADERWGLVGIVDTLLLSPLAAAGKWDEWTGHLDRAIATLRESGLVDRDVALYAERASKLASEAGKADEADKARGLAIWQWESIGEVDRAELLAGELSISPYNTGE